MASEKIVFAQSVTIRTLNPDDGAISSPLTSSSGFNYSYHPAWSPDRTQIVFARYNVSSGQQGGLFIMPAAGAVSPPQFHNVGFHPTWSPDSTKIAFFTTTGIYVKNIGGVTAVQLTNNGSQPAWSPDGTKIAFQRNAPGGTTGINIWIMDAITGDPTGNLAVPLTADVSDQIDSFPSWSPDGTKIAFQRKPPGGSAVSRIYVVDSDGSTSPVALTSGSTGTEHDDYPTWSSDGGYIAFSGYLSSTYAKIYRINANGSNSQALSIEPSGELLFPNWSSPGILNAPNHEGSSYCPICYIGDDEHVIPFPTSIRKGEKREEVTDLSLNTPAGSLAFTRTFRQSKLGQYTGMGLGWTHNHDSLIDDSVSGKLIVRLPNGSQAHFTQVGTSNQYTGDAGSNSVIDVNPGSTDARYTLTASDQSTYIFNSSKRLLSRTWPNGEKWLYEYYKPSDGADLDGRLKRVEDGYGRALQFTYNRDTHPDAFARRKLRYVGDQNATGLDTLSPNGNFITFSYIADKPNGTGALLSQVIDVRGKSWVYDYYGQDGPETAANLLNFLTEVRSPSVDTSGDGTPDSSLTLKRLTYSYDTQLAKNGDMELDSDWSSVGTPINQRSSVQKYNGTYARYVKTTIIGHGIEGNAWKLIAGRTYNITAKIYLVSGSGSVKMTVGGTTAFTDQIIASPIGSWQTLTMPAVIPTSTSQNHKLQFLGVAANTEFYVDGVSIIETNPVLANMTQELGIQGAGSPLVATRYDFQPQGENVTTEKVIDPSTDQFLTTHQFAGGVYLGPKDALGNAREQRLNLDYRPSSQKDANGNTTKLAWGLDGKRLDQVTDALNNQTAFSYNPNDTLKDSTDAEGRKTTYLYDANSRQPTMILVSNSATELITNGSMEADSNWTNVGSPAVNERLSAKVDGGDHARHVATTSVGYGIQGNAWDLIANQTYTITARVYPVSGVVKLQVPGVAAFDKITTGTGAWETLSATYTPGSNNLGRNLQFVSSGGGAEFYVDSVSITTEAELAVNGSMELDSSWTAVNGATSQRSSTMADAGTYSRYVVATTAGQGTEGNTWSMLANQTYTIRARVYPVSGSVKMQVPGVTAFDVSTAETGAWQTLSAIYTPAVDIPTKKLQFVSLGGAATFYVDSVSILLTRELAVNGDMELDTSWTPVNTPSTNVRRPRVDTGDYYRHVTATTTGAGIGSAAWALTANRTYLMMARVYAAKGTIQMRAFAGSGTIFSKLTTSSNVWETLRIVYKPAASTSGVSLQFIVDSLVGGSAEFYVDTVHIIDLGVVSGDIEDVVRWQEFMYDSRGRVLEESSLSPLDASLVQQGIRSYYASGNGNGLLKQMTQKDVVGAGANSITTTYTYDRSGRVVKSQQNSLVGDCCGTITEYDAAGNVLTTTSIRDISQLSNATINPVTAYEYDPMGRRIKVTTNSRTALFQRTVTVYDAMNRVIRTITNYKPVVGITNPYTVARSAFDSYHGADNTENLVTDTIYNSRGLVESQTDVLGSVTRLVYDLAGRLIRTIANYTPQGSPVTDPAAWIWNNNRWEYTTNNPVNHGNNDQNRITEQQYDAAGNLVKTVDVLRNVTFTVYDELNRPKKVVRTAKDSATLQYKPGDVGYVAANDPRSASYTISADPDRDLIDETTYDKMGRVIRSARLMENRPTQQWDYTLFGYDTLGRQVKTIRSANTPNYDLASDPDLSGYSAVGNPDKDLVTITAYDEKGRLLYNQDAMGIQTWQGYDGLGRQVKTIVNPKTTAQDGGVNDPRSSSYVPSTVADEDLMTGTTYDGNGRVLETKDPFNRVARTVYDSTGRVIRTVTNFVDQGEDPALWVWNNGWKKNNGTTAIVHGTDNDQNIIASSEYDGQGRVSKTIDHRNNATIYVYDALGRRTRTVVNYVPQGTTNPANWIWDAGAIPPRWEDGANNAIIFGTDMDQNRITVTTYDLAGQVIRERDAAGVETRYEYDAAGRRTKTTANYMDGSFNANTPDEDLSSTTIYNISSQIISTTDTRGTQTAFTYDKTGRRLTLTQAANSPLATTSYTCYDKAGRVLRSIQNYVVLVDSGGQPISPDAKDGSGNWLFVPTSNGHNNDRNLITLYTYDLASRQVTVTNPVGSVSTTAYSKDGQVQSITNPENAVTQYRYDDLRRRTRVIQGFVDQGEDPALWVWDDAVGQKRWEKSNGTAIAHGTNNDENIIVLVTYDKAGRMIDLRDPRGIVTRYAHDRTDRRIKHIINYVQQGATDPANWVWDATDGRWEDGGGNLIDLNPPANDRNLIRQTRYLDLTTGATQNLLIDPKGITTERNFDRLGRPANIKYGSPGNTPDVKFTFDAMGNRSKMSEFGPVSNVIPIRTTDYQYDDLHHLKAATFTTDSNADGTPDGPSETVSYQYDAGGLRTKLTVAATEVNYTYDTKGQLTAMGYGSNQQTQFLYDQAGRLAAAVRNSYAHNISGGYINGMESHYAYDAGGRLRELQHHERNRTLARFQYNVDKRGNRTQAIEKVAHPSTTVSTIGISDPAVSYYRGTWTTSGVFKLTTDPFAAMAITFSGSEVELTMGVAPDHGIFDIYIDGAFWETFDNYGASGERVINLVLNRGGSHVLDIRNRGQQHIGPYDTIRFKQIKVLNTTYDERTITYGYDKLSRLLSAGYAGITPSRQYTYKYDRAGNRTQQVATIGGAPTTTNYTFDNANRLTADGTNTYGYDNNGNLTTANGVGVMTWDRANRLLSATNGVVNPQYKYDGAGNRIQQTVGANVTKYLLDLQPGLPVVLQETTGSTTTRYVHSPMGIHMVNEDRFMLQDGLGSVRSVVNKAITVQETRQYDPIGNPFSATGTNQTDYGFTGEPTDDNSLLYLRARYYNPTLGVFMSLDPFEGMADRPMSLNSYSYVEGNSTNWTDPSGYGTINPFCVLVEGVCLESIFPNYSPEQIKNFEVALNLIPGRNYTQQELIDAATQTDRRGGNNDWWKIWLLLYAALQGLQNPTIPDTPRRDNDIGCGCGYDAGPGEPTSEKPFQSDIDILCWLRCYSGFEEILFYNAIPSPQSVPITFDPSAPDFGQFRKSIRQIILRHPSHYTRADMIGTLVEEIYHAGQFYSAPGVLPCKGLDGKGLLTLDAEVEAKTKKLQWMEKVSDSGKVSRGDFRFTNIIFFGINSELAPYIREINAGANPYIILPHECPESTQTVLNISVNCIDPLVVRELTRVFI